MKIKYNNKNYEVETNDYISLHHYIILFYEKYLKKELNILKQIYISHILYNKEYKIWNGKKEELNKNSLYSKKVETILLNIEYNEKYIFDLCMPFIKILIISLLIIIRIDIFLSTSYNNHIKSFEDYYIFILYIFILLLLFLIPYYSYKVIIRFIQYTIEQLDKDIGIFMSTYLESYNILDVHNYNKVEYKKWINEEEEKKINKKDEI